MLEDAQIKEQSQENQGIYKFDVVSISDADSVKAVFQEGRQGGGETKEDIIKTSFDEKYIDDGDKCPVGTETETYDEHGRYSGGGTDLNERKNRYHDGASKRSKQDTDAGEVQDFEGPPAKRCKYQHGSRCCVEAHVRAIMADVNSEQERGTTWERLIGAKANDLST